jgi:hypothetical protein
VILESIVTTVDALGHVNIAPMGPRTNHAQSEFVLRPFTSSLTCQNLITTRRAVIHVTDDVMLFAKAAVDAIDRDQVADYVQPKSNGQYWILKKCHRWFAVEVTDISGTEPRIDMGCRIVDSGTVGPFFGFNRAKHATIEAAILATRVHVLPPSEIQAEIDRLRPLIDKTAGPDEHEAFAFLVRTIDERFGNQ